MDLPGLPASLLRAENRGGGRPPGPGGRHVDQAWSERSSLGKGPIWSLKEVLSLRVTVSSGPATAAFKGQLGGPKGPASLAWPGGASCRLEAGQGAHGDNLESPLIPQRAPNLPKKPGHRHQRQFGNCYSLGGRPGAGLGLRLSPVPPPAADHQDLPQEAAGVLAGEKWGTGERETPRPPHGRSAGLCRMLPDPVSMRVGPAQARAAVREKGRRAGGGPGRAPRPGAPSRLLGWAQRLRTQPGVGLSGAHMTATPPGRDRGRGRGRDADR